MNKYVIVYKYIYENLFDFLNHFKSFGANMVNKESEITLIECLHFMRHFSKPNTQEHNYV